MQRLVVLGAGTAGTMIVNRLRPRLDDAWQIVVVDPSPVHLYQPGFLFVPFGEYQPRDIVKHTRDLITSGVDLVEATVERVDADTSRVELADGRTLAYDYLVIATGTHPRPEETPGLDSEEFGRTIHTFYTLEGVVALREALADFEGGRLVVNIVEMPIKCPPAPLEFTFLADAFFRDRGRRDDIDITFVTPLPGAFTKPVASRYLGHMLDDRGIGLETDYYLERVEPEARKLISYDEREVPYDLLVTVPINMGADFVAASGLGDELNHVRVDRHTFRHEDHSNVFALGDAANLPTSKAGSVAHFAVEVFTENFLHLVDGLQMPLRFDGHANCFIETGHGKAMLIDFNYDVEPLRGSYPLPGLGPMALLKESQVNHWGKLLFKWMYWHLLLPGRELPLPALMSMAGKIPEEA